MSRQPNLEFARIEDSILMKGNKYGIMSQQLAATLTMDADMPQVVFLDPNSSGRTVLLPPEAKGLWYRIVNSGTVAAALTVKDDANLVTYASINIGEAVDFYSNGTLWYVLPGGLGGGFAGLTYQGPAATVLTTAGAATLTIAQLLTGLICRDPNGASRTDTFPTAALAVAGCPGVKVGSIVECTFNNTADAAETITFLAGSGGTLFAGIASAIIAQNASKKARLRFTNVTAASETYDLFV